MMSVLFLGIVGPGAWSLDAVLGRSLPAAGIASGRIHQVQLAGECTTIRKVNGSRIA
jgi:hypothetical protein